MKTLHQQGYHQVGYTHFNYLSPLPKNTREVLGRFKKVLVCELNNGQHAKLLSMRHDQSRIYSYTKIQGLPFAQGELLEAFKQHLS